MRMLSRVLALGLLAAALGACGRPDAGPQEAPGTRDPGDVAASPPGEGAVPTPEPSPVEPTPGMTGVHAVPWEEATVASGGSTVRVSWWSGVAPCTVLDRVETTEDARSVTITLFEGSDPDEPDAACPMIAVYKSVDVTLEAPLGDRDLRDGTR